MSDLIESKADFTGIYNHPTSVRYYNELLIEKALVERNEILAKYTEKALLPIFKEWSRKLGRPLKLLDFLCSYGNDTLSVTNCFHAGDFEKMWGSEQTCHTLPKPRQFPVHTWGCDLSANACAYGEKAGIFDETQVANMNELTDAEKRQLKDRCKNANLFMINSLVYLNDGVLDELLEWFSQGTEPGFLIVGFIFPYDGVERSQSWKALLLKKFKFFNSIATANRYLSQEERREYGAEFGTWEKSYYEIWFLQRNV